MIIVHKCIDFKSWYKSHCSKVLSRDVIWLNKSYGDWKGLTVNHVVETNNNQFNNKDSEEEDINFDEAWNHKIYDYVQNGKKQLQPKLTRWKSIEQWD